MKITKKELREVIQEVAEEMGLFEGLTKAQEKLPEPLKKAILKKQESDHTEDDSVEEGLTKAQEKLPEPLKKAILKKQEESDEESIEEGNAFGAAVKAARENGDSEFKVGDKTYQLKEKVTEEVEDTEEFIGDHDHEEDVEEGNAFGAAVKKAKEDGDSEFEVDGKTYKVKEVVCPDCGEEPCVGEASCSEEDEEDVEEGNAFGAAVKKAKEDGDSEFEVDGKTYKVKESSIKRFSENTLSETLARISGKKKILNG